LAAEFSEFCLPIWLSTSNLLSTLAWLSSVLMSYSIGYSIRSGA